jgi:hypothetical protein
MQSRGQKQNRKIQQKLEKWGWDINPVPLPHGIAVKLEFVALFIIY